MGNMILGYTDLAIYRSNGMLRCINQSKNGRKKIHLAGNDSSVLGSYITNTNKCDVLKYIISKK